MERNCCQGFIDGRHKSLESVVYRQWRQSMCRHTTPPARTRRRWDSNHRALSLSTPPSSRPSCPPMKEKKKRKSKENTPSIREVQAPLRAAKSCPGVHGAPRLFLAALWMHKIGWRGNEKPAHDARLKAWTCVLRDTTALMSRTLEIACSPSYRGVSNCDDQLCRLSIN